MNYPMSPLNMQNYQGQLAALQNQIAQIGQLYQTPQPQVPQPMQPQNIPAPQQYTKQIEYVNGIDGAKAYQIAPNSSVILMDSDKQRFYAKSADANGFITLKAFEFMEADDAEIAPTEYVTKKEFDQLMSKVSALVDKEEQA